MFDLYNRSHQAPLLSIPVKANKLLQLLLLVLLLIVVKLWHLAIIQHEKKVDEAFRPRRKVVWEQPKRGTIRDRFGISLAENKISFRASCVFRDLRSIPSVVYKMEHGEKRKHFLRKEYIQALSMVLAKELSMDEKRIEDIIYSHAALYDSVPYVLKENLTEQEYFRLKMLEKDWLGIRAEKKQMRIYPHAKVASDVLGYVGSMPKDRYDAILQEMKTLSEYINRGESFEGDMTIEDAKKRLVELQEKAYQQNSEAGVLGVEASFDADLRGFAGKKVYFSDAKGNFLRALDGSHPSIAGKRLFLSLSIELQEYAEKLLAQNEKERESRVEDGVKVPWMKGGAIVAIDPNTGQVIALASYPRYDLNDFMQRTNNQQLLRWIENESFQAAVWDGKMPLTRELYSPSKGWYEEEKWLSWKHFLELILPTRSKLLELLHEETPLREILTMQQAFYQLLAKAPAVTGKEAIELLYDNQGNFAQDFSSEKEILDRIFLELSNKEKLLYIDLSRLIICFEEIDPLIAQKIGSLSIGEYRTLCSSFAKVTEAVRKDVLKQFSSFHFATWRKLHEKEFLKKKRTIEKEQKKQALPYLDYLDSLEKKSFQIFWKKWRAAFIEYALFQKIDSREDFHEISSYLGHIHPVQCTELTEVLQKFEGVEIPLFLQTMHPFSDLVQPLFGTYRGIAPKGTPAQLKHLAGSFIKSLGAGYRSHAYRQWVIQGSIFKLITAYSGLKQRYLELFPHKKQIQTSDLALFDITDSTYKSESKNYVGYFQNGKPIPQIYKGGRIPKSLSPNLGKMDLLQAIEVSSNPYFSILAGDYLKDPLDLKRAATDFGYGEKSSIELPGENKGNIPSDLQTNRTGLYATAIGQHTLVTTPLQTALMLTSLANGGKLFKPHIALLLAGKTFVESKMQITSVKPEVRRELFLPQPLRSVLLDGMRRVVLRMQAQGNLSSAEPAFIGKTSTSEVMEKIGLDYGIPSTMYRHIWFGGIAFDPHAPSTEQHPFVFYDSFGKPELVVVAYLRFAGYGKEAAPLALKMVQEWRKIKAKYQKK
jgi:cell division protein FtsI/penicillin-binding protein 2